MKNPFKENNRIELCTSIIEPDSWGCLEEGYYWAVKILLEEIINSNIYQNRWVSYSIMFNIRHYYELSLKDILINLGYIYDQKYLIQDHKLDILLNTVESAVKEYINQNRSRLNKRLLINDVEKTFKIIRTEMDDFIILDNLSFSFRYPYSKTGKVSIEQPYIFDAEKIYKSVITCRKELLKVSTQLICDESNKNFK